MIIPFALGTLGGILLIAVFSRHKLIYALLAAFISGALAGVSPTLYATFAGLFLGVLTLYVIREVGEITLEKVLALYLGIILIWSSDNAAVATAMRTLVTSLVQPLFDALTNTLGTLFPLGAAFVTLLAWSLFAPRLLHLAEEAPLLGIGYVYLGYSVISSLISMIPQTLVWALALALLPQVAQAFRGRFEAVEVAPYIFILTHLLDKTVLVSLVAVVAIIDLALGLLSKKRLAASAFWATAATLL